MPGLFVIVRDARGSLVHIRTRDGECVGCIEAGLYETCAQRSSRKRGRCPMRQRNQVSTGPSREGRSAWGR